MLYFSRFPAANAPRCYSSPVFKGLIRLVLGVAAFLNLHSSASAEQPGWLEDISVTGCKQLQVQGENCALPVTINSIPQISWEELLKRRGVPNYMLPPNKEELNYTLAWDGKGRIGTEDLMKEVPRWLSLRFDDPVYQATETWVLSTGNILEAFQQEKGQDDRQRERLKILEKLYPRVWKAVAPFLSEWALDQFVYSADWDPSKRGSFRDLENDSILERPPFLRIPKPVQAPDHEEKKNKPHHVYQGCIPIFASLPAIVGAEFDFRNYHQHLGYKYREVYPLEGTCFKGFSPSGFPFASYNVAFRQNILPGIFLKFILNQFVHHSGDKWVIEAHLVRGDMHYFRSKIVYDPIHTAAGEIIGYVKTEWMAFDVKGLPDRQRDRVEGLRADLGNIKRLAEIRHKALTQAK